MEGSVNVNQLIFVFNTQVAGHAIAKLLNCSDRMNAFRAGILDVRDVITCRHRKCTRNLVELLITNFSIEGLQLMHAVGIPWSSHITSTAARAGDLLCLSFAHKNGCPWDISTTTYAAEAGHLKCLQYALNNECPWSHQITYNAACNGQLECLRYAIEFGCSMHPNTADTAARHGHLKCLQYAHQEGCSLNTITVLKTAENGHPDCLKYVLESGCKYNEFYIIFMIIQKIMYTNFGSRRRSKKTDNTITESNTRLVSKADIQCLTIIYENRFNKDLSLLPLNHRSCRKLQRKIFKEQKRDVYLRIQQ